MNNALLSARLRMADYRDRMICKLLTSWPCGVGGPTRFDIRHRQLAKKALVLATEPACAPISNFERRTLESVFEHAVRSSMQYEAAPDMKWVHGSRAEVDARIERSY